MPQFFIEHPIDENKEIEINGADARHVTQVLRLKADDWIMLSDGRGFSFRAIITSISTSKVRAKIVEEIKKLTKSPPPTLAIALIKGDRFEWAIQKAVEIGCQKIIPFYSSRTVPQYKESGGTKKIARWQKIALEAAKQSGLPFKPQINSLTGFTELLSLSDNFEHKVLFYEGEKGTDIKSHLKFKQQHKDTVLIVGPEGGFTSEEVLLATQKGAATVSLGSQILKVETAAIVALTIWQYELGNIDLIF